MLEINEDNRNAFGLQSGNSYFVGQAIGDGNCFFDSFRQGLIALGVTEQVDVPRLREICAEVAQSPPQWLPPILSRSRIDSKTVRSETTDQYVERILQDGEWGDPEIDGRILCEFFKVSIYLIEVIQAQAVITKSIITSDEGVRSVAAAPSSPSKVVCIINRGHNHFEPIIQSDITVGSLTSNITNNDEEGEENNRLVNSRLSSVTSTTKLLLEPSPTSSTSLSSVSQTTAQVSCQGRIYNLELPKEFENVHRAVLAHDLVQVEESLVEYRNVMHYQCSPEQEFMQHSLYDAMLSYNIRIVELVYEHWATVYHKSHPLYLQSLRRVGQALVAARDNCYKKLSQILIDVHCIIEFNRFKIQLHRELIDYREPPPYILPLNDIQRLIHQIIGRVVTAINVYTEFSKRFTNVYDNELVDFFSLDEILIKIADDNSLNMNVLLYVMFEKYYSKLDFAIATTILQYIHFLKLKLELPKDTYEKVECTLYYVMYRFKEKWRLCLPDGLVKKQNHRTNSRSLSKNIDVFNDTKPFAIGPLVYMEWQKRKESLLNFKQTLETTSVKDQISTKGSELSESEVHYLSMFTYLRDEYALQKMIKYLEVCVRTIKRCSTHNGTLVVQRAIQVIGELLKSTERTEDTHQISMTTKSLIYAKIPRLVLCNLFTLIKYFSQITNGKLVRKIHLEETNPELFIEVDKDLKQIQNILQGVLDVYKPIVEKIFIENGLSLVHEQQKKLSVTLEEHISIVGKMFKTVNNFNYIEELSDRENRYTDDEWSEFGSNKSVFKEHNYLCHLIITLKKEWKDQDVTSIKTIVKNLNAYFDYIEIILNDIETNLITWNKITINLNRLSVQITTDGPTKDSLKIIETVIKKFSLSEAEICSDLKSKLNLIVLDWTSEWSIILNLLEFLVEELPIFDKNPKQIKNNQFTLMLKNISNYQSDTPKIIELRTFLDIMKQEINKYCSKNHILTTFPVNSYNYMATDRLTKAMSRILFITKKEAGYLKLKIGKCKCLSTYCMHEALVEKILSGESISVDDQQTVMKNVEMNNECKAIIQNLVVGNVRDPCLLQCFTMKTDLLKKKIGDQQVSQMVQRYHYDDDFRLTVEALLADIHNILTECQLWHFFDAGLNQLLQRHISRNILEYNNSFLEVASKKIDTPVVLATLFEFVLNLADKKVASLIEPHIASPETLPVTKTGQLFSDVNSVSSTNSLVLSSNFNSSSSPITDAKRVTSVATGPKSPIVIASEINVLAALAKASEAVALAALSAAKAAESAALAAAAASSVASEAATAVSSIAEIVAALAPSVNK